MKYVIIIETAPHIPAIAPIAITAPKQISALVISLFAVSWVMVPILSVVVSIAFAMTDLLICSRFIISYFFYIFLSLLLMLFYFLICRNNAIQNSTLEFFLRKSVF